MSRPKQKCKSPVAELEEVIDLIQQARDDYHREMRGVSHVDRTEPLPKGRAYTVLTECADDCPACAIQKRYAALETDLGVRRRSAREGLERSSLRSAAGLRSAQAAPKKKKPVLTPRKVAAALRRCKHHTQKGLRMELHVSQPTLRAFLKKHPIFLAKLTKRD